jgi:N-acetylglucosamine kinase-like BadF-type ATPase
MSFYLAVDAGGTKTDYAIADDSTLLARVRTGTIKRMRTDAVTALRNLEEALAQLTAASGISLRSIQRTCIGAAGNTVPMVHNFLLEQFSARASGDVLIVNDVDIALDAAFAGRPGVLVLAGTGSNVAGRTERGEVTTAGGWGPTLADQGSGHRIGLKGLRAVFAAIDTEQPTILLDAILRSWELQSLEALVDHANRIPSPDFSQLTRIIVDCADAGDLVAQEVLRREAQALARLAALVIRRVGQASTQSGWVPSVAFAGSILENVSLVRSALVAQLEHEFPGIATLPGVVDPIQGAIWRARAGWLEKEDVSATEHFAFQEEAN